MAVALPTPTPTSRLLARLRTYNYAPLLALVVLFIISSLLSEHFRQPGNLLNIVRQVSFPGIIALGMTFVIIGGGIDLSVGSMMALVGWVTVTTVNRLGGETGAPGVLLPLAVAAALACGGALGLTNGLLVTAGRIAPFIVTLGTLAIFRSLTLYAADAGEVRSTSDAFYALGESRPLGLPTAVWVFLLLAAALNVLLNNTRFGRHACAVGSNEKVAQYAAVGVDRVRVVTYVIAGFTVAVSAVLASARTNSMNSTNFGAGMELDAIAAVIIGGTPMTGGRGSIWGTVVGAIMLGIINNMLNMMSVDTNLVGTVKGLVIIVAALVQRRL